MTDNNREQNAYQQIVSGVSAVRNVARAVDNHNTNSSNSLSRRYGIIHAIDTLNDVVDVDIAGEIIPGVARIASYAPTIGETVLLDVVGTDLVVVDTIAPSLKNDFDKRLTEFRHPVGDIEPTIRKTPKSNTLFLDGSTPLRAQYPTLWQWANDNALVVPGMFTIGNGTTTFGLPDFRGRVPVGVGTLAGEVYDVGTTVGTAKPTITTAQMPAHNHAVSVAAHGSHSHGFDGDHTHLYPGDNNVGPGTQLVAGGSFTVRVDSGTNFATGSAGSHAHSSVSAGSHTVTQSTVGGTTPLDVRQPSIGINWLIWT
jgi:microcystin-dependent protein